jgi:hypothetical protein
MDAKAKFDDGMLPSNVTKSLIEKTSICVMVDNFNFNVVDVNACTNDTC